MDEKIKSILSELSLSAPASSSDLERLSHFFSKKIPEEYMDFLLISNGGEGFLGNNYLILWKAEEIEKFNEEYESSQYAPGIILFGSNGGGEAFGFDANRENSIIAIPFVGMDLEFSKIISRKFDEFLFVLKNDPEII